MMLGREAKERETDQQGPGDAPALHACEKSGMYIKGRLQQQQRVE
jgi:hypothetical protein